MSRSPQSGHSERPPDVAPEPSHAHFVLSDHSFGLKRLAKKAGVVVGTGATFVAALAAGVVVHAGTAPARRLASAAVNQILSGTFRGKIEIARVGGIAIDRVHAGVDGVDALLTDHEGNPLARVGGVHARLSLFPLLASLLSRGDMKIHVTDLSIDDVDVLVTQAPDGSLTIADAFQPAEAGPPPPPDKNASGLDLSFSKIALKHAWVHGGVSGVPTIDADLDDLSASFAMTPKDTSVDLRNLRVATRSMPSHADVAAAVEARLDLPEDAKAMVASGHVGGSVGGVPIDVNGSFDHQKVDAVVDVPQADTAAINRLLGGEILYQVAAAHIEAHGTLPNLQPSAHLTVGKGTVDLGGAVTLPSDGQPDTRAQITLAARNLDMRAASATGPASKLGVDASVNARLAQGGAYDGSYDVHVLPGTFGPQQVPDARVHGTLSPTVIRGTAHISEPGMPADLGYEVQPLAKGGPDIAFDASVKSRDLTAVPLLAGAVKGGVTVHAAGRIALGTKEIAAHVESTLDKIDAGSVTVGHARVEGLVGGTFTAPSGTIAIAGEDLRATRYVYPRFDVNAGAERGEVRFAADLHGGSAPDVVATGTVDTKTTSARDVAVTLKRGKDEITARVASARSGAGGVDVAGIRLEGAGDPLDGELHFRAGRLAARVQAPGIDVPTVLRVAGIKSDGIAGRVGLDVDVTADRRTTKGHANVTVEEASYGGDLKDLSAKIATAFDGRKAELHLDAHDATKNSVKLDTENGTLGAGALDARAWTGATGRVLGGVNVNLDAVRKAAHGAMPFNDLRGWLTAKLDVERDDAKARPRMAIEGGTRDLVFTTEPQTVDGGDHTVVVVGRPFHSDGLDASFKASLDAESGKTSLDARLRDKEGPLVSVNGSATLPMRDLLGDGDPTDALESMAVRAHAEMPLRSIGAVPVLFASVPARGSMGFTFDAEGTAKQPTVRAVVQARDIIDADDPTPVPISFDVNADYDGSALKAKIGATQKNASVLDVAASVALKASDALAGKLAWEANADAHFTKFPVGAVTGFFDENAIDADLNGSIALRDLHKAGHLDVDLDLANIAINGAKFGDTKATVKLEQGSLAADVRMNQADGFAAVHVTSGLGWGDAVTPTLDTKLPIDVGLQAKNFRIGMFGPFVRSAASELDGRLNANTKLHVLPGMKDGTMDGAILVDRGLFETPALGEELHDLRARIYMKPWGVWNVAEISASGTTGRFTANAVAKVDGFSFQTGEAHVKIAEKEKFPLDMQGMELGTVWGQVDVKGALAADKKTVNVDVSVPNLHIMLPQSIAHGVQSTDPDGSIKVGSIEPSGVVAVMQVDGSLPPPEPPKPKPKTTEPAMKLHVTTHLGPDFEIRRDTTVRAYVSEGPVIDIGDATKISGSLDVPRGYIELDGKRFQIDKAKVTFTGQPVDDPVVVATASYDSPDGTKVFADFIGPVKTGKVTLRSEPTLSQNEILALLLFGTADGTFGQGAPPGQQGNDVTQAASLAGGVVTQGLNKAISGVSGVEVQTKVDTQESGDPRPEVEVALSRDVSATIIYNLGVPPPGQNPDDTLLLVDWRFHKNYSTEATVGDKGTSILDLTWKYRY